ncbi:peroxiredoxin-6-like [Haliotis asinina]|uniref:peroxiredoxin-6-like n=1 Tax=Haliotis asinina TaxID=109174 RepID=UPI00353191A0
MVNLGDVFPNFQVDSTAGRIDFHEWLGNSWAILFSHPADYTPVCTTELGRVVQLVPEFQKRGVKLIALSCDDVESHKGWSKDVLAYVKETKDFPYPIISDKDRSLAVKLGMVDPDEKDSAGMPLTCRAVFIIGPDKKLKLSFLYPATTGRNFNEILRVIDSLQLTATKKVATPVDWKAGDKCMVVPSLSNDEAKKMFPDMTVVELPSGKQYVRMTPVDSQVRM